MLLELSIPWVIALNSTAIPVLQTGLAWLYTRLPDSWFECGVISAPGGRTDFYERWLRIKGWKDRVPDGASWFGGGFGKARLNNRSLGHLERFVLETRRGEACHWNALLFTPLFFLWNPPWACVVMAVAMVGVNLPCIAIQRYNRVRLARTLARRRVQSSALARSEDS